MSVIATLIMTLCTCIAYELSSITNTNHTRKPCYNRENRAMPLKFRYVPNFTTASCSLVFLPHHGFLIVLCLQTADDYLSITIVIIIQCVMEAERVNIDVDKRKTQNEQVFATQSDMLLSLEI